jgi:outer membrane lipoprotein-sorting protein/cytochrome c551/c552
MSNPFNSDEEVLARLIHAAGDPSVAPGPQYAEKLRATILDRVRPAETVAPETEVASEDVIRSADVIPSITLERNRKMKRLLKFAVAATIVAAIGIPASWITRGGSNSVAFARVAEVLDSLKSATFDVTSEMKGEKDQPPATATGKGFFLAPALQRVEISTGSAKNGTNMITISDSQTAKSLMLMPDQKLAVAMNTEKMRENVQKTKGTPPDFFEAMRRLVREGSSGTGEKVEKLGKKEIDGHQAVGFHLGSNGSDMTLWADPQTALPIRIEFRMAMLEDVCVVMNHFRYDVALEPSLFSLDPPAGYSTQAMSMAKPVEEDLVRILRTVAEHSKGVFPAKLAMNKEVMGVMTAMVEPEMEKIAAKYGGMAKLKEKGAKEPPPALMAEAMKTIMPLMQKQMQGITFYMMLTAENDPHYAGGSVKLGTPDRPILWYKPTGAAKYHVIYADLSVKEMTPDEVKKLPQASAK